MKLNLDIDQGGQCPLLSGRGLVISIENGDELLNIHNNDNGGFSISCFVGDVYKQGMDIRDGEVIINEFGKFRDIIIRNGEVTVNNYGEDE